jgi:DNA-binding transcriptional ArsR family regulator
MRLKLYYICMMVQMSNSDRSKTTGSPCCGGLAALLSPRLFKALSDPKRLSLLVRVAEEGCPCTVSHVAKDSGVDMSMVSRHLAILREAGIIKCEKQGKEVLCTLQTDVVVGVLRQIADALESCCPEEKGLPGRSTDAPSSARRSRRK